MMKKHILLFIMTAAVCTMSASDFRTSEPLRLTLPSMDASSLSEKFKSRHESQRTPGIASDTKQSNSSSMAQAPLDSPATALQS